MAAIKLNRVLPFDLNARDIKEKITQQRNLFSVTFSNEEENTYFTQGQEIVPSKEETARDDIKIDENDEKEEGEGEGEGEGGEKKARGSLIPQKGQKSDDNIQKKRKSSILRGLREENILGVFSKLSKIPSSFIQDVKDKIQDQKRANFQRKLKRKRTMQEEFLMMRAGSITVRNILPVLKMLFMIASTIIGFLLNILGIINMIIISYMRLYDIQEKYVDAFEFIELVVGIYYIVENVADIYTAESWLEQLLSPKTVADVCIILEIFWQYLNYRRNWVVIFFGALRSIKIKKMRSIFSTCVKTIKKYIYRDNSEKLESKTGNEIKALVINSMIDLLMWIFIEASFILAVNEILDYSAFNPFEPNKKNGLDYLTAMYYVIVSLMTIGYGDISPKLNLSRLFITVTLLTNIVILSDFLGKFTDMLMNLSPYIKKYKLKNHIIILGDIPFSFLEVLLEEILLVDKIHNKIHNLNIKKKNKVKKNLIKILIVNPEEPSAEVRNLINRMNFNYEDTLVMYLKSNIMDQKWYELSSLKKAKQVFAFSLNFFQTSYDQLVQRDKHLSLAASNIKDYSEKVPVSLVLSTNLSNLLKNMSQVLKIEIISTRTLDERIMANSLENPGFNTILAHLFNNRQIKIPKEVSSYWVPKYIRELHQDIHAIKFPTFFVGKTFSEAAKIIYFSQLDLNQISLMPGVKTEIISQSPEILLIGIEEGNLDSLEEILLNPTNYVIKEQDTGYVICRDENALDNIQMIDSQHSLLYLRYLKNFDFIEKNYKTPELMEDLEKIFSTTDNKYKNYSIKKEALEKIEMDNKDLKRIPSLKRRTQVENNQEPLFVENNFISSTFDLSKNKSPQGIFENHIVVVGTMERFIEIVNILRFYSKRPVLLYSDKSLNFRLWKKITSRFKNVYFVFGSLSSIPEIAQLNLDKAYRILILSSNESELFQDSDAVIFARLVSDYFELSTFLVELVDSDMMRFLSRKPNLAEGDTLDHFLWPNFAFGQAHLTALSMSVLARSIFKKNWLNFFFNLARPASDGEPRMDEVIENKKVQSIVLTEEITSILPYYGVLIHFLMEQPCPIIPIGMMKQGKSVIKRQETGKPAPKKSMMSTLINQKKFSYVLTNPSFFTKLKPGDTIIIFGTPTDSRFQDGMMSSRSFPKLTSFNMNSPHGANENDINSIESIVNYHFKNFQLERRKKFKNELIDYLQRNNESIRGANSEIESYY